MVEIRDVSKQFGEVHAVDGVSLEIKAGEMLCLLGPSGCGKTTLLRLLSGFLKPSAGAIIMDGKDVTTLPAERRPTSLVFQNYALFPHMDVFENIAFGLKIKKLPMVKIKESVAEMLALVGLSKLENRAIQQLSGGQQQRVALARALVMKPSVLLLDEPLSNLDAKLRVETRIQIRQIQQSVGITSIFVTHDQEEALTISDRVAIMNKGKIIQIGTPVEIYNTPNSNFVADFIGKSNFLGGSYEKENSDSGVFTLLDGTRIPIARSPASGSARKIMIRPEKMKLHEQAPQSGCAVPGVVKYITFLGEIVYYHLALRTGEMVMVPVYGTSGHDAEKPIGMNYIVSWEAGSCLLLE